MTGARTGQPVRFPVSWAAATVIALGCTQAAARLLRLGHGARISAVLCGSQKILADGLPMAAVLFGDRAALMIQPLMVYHQLQLVICAALARRWSRPSGRAAVGGAPVAVASQS